MISKLSSGRYLPCLLIAFLIYGCIVLPKTVPEEDQGCLLATKSLTIDYYTSSEIIDEAVDEMFDALTSDCHEPECLLLFAPLIAISAGSFVVSGSIVVAGNTIHWIEEQGRCDDSVTRQSLAGVISSVKKVGGSVISTCKELIEWFQNQGFQNKQPIEDIQDNEI